MTTTSEQSRLQDASTVAEEGASSHVETIRQSGSVATSNTHDFLPHQHMDLQQEHHRDQHSNFDYTADLQAYLDTLSIPPSPSPSSQLDLPWTSIKDIENNKLYTAEDAIRLAASTPPISKSYHTHARSQDTTSSLSIRQQLARTTSNDLLIAIPSDAPHQRVKVHIKARIHLENHTRGGYSFSIPGLCVLDEEAEWPDACVRFRWPVPARGDKHGKVVTLLRREEQGGNAILSPGMRGDTYDFDPRFPLELRILDVEELVRAACHRDVVGDCDGVDADIGHARTSCALLDEMHRDVCELESLLADDPSSVSGLTSGCGVRRCRSWWSYLWNALKFVLLLWLVLRATVHDSVVDWEYTGIKTLGVATGFGGVTSKTASDAAVVATAISDHKSAVGSVLDDMVPLSTELLNTIGMTLRLEIKGGSEDDGVDESQDEEKDDYCDEDQGRDEHETNDGDEDNRQYEEWTGPQSLRDRIDWWLGWRGPEGKWPACWQ